PWLSREYCYTPQRAGCAARHIARRLSSCPTSSTPATRCSATVGASPTLTPTSPGPSAPSAVSSVTSSPAYRAGTPGRAARSSCNDSPLVASTTASSTTWLPWIGLTPGSVPGPAIASCSTSGARWAARARVCTTAEAGLCSIHTPGWAWAICSTAEVTWASRFCWSSVSSTGVRCSSPVVDTSPCSAPWLPTRSVPGGGAARWNRSANGRPETRARCTPGAALSRRSASADAGSGRASAGSSTKGARQPSKSSATSTSGAAMNVCSARVSPGPTGSVPLGREPVVSLMRIVVVGQCGEELAGPGLHVPGQHPFAQRPHPAPPLRRLHRGRPHHRRLQALDVVRVDQQRLTELVRGAGELAEHQHPAQVVPGGHVLLGHQVHPVPQRRHQHHVGRPVQGHHLLLRVGVVHVVDRRAAPGAVLAVDVTDHLLHLLAQVPVLLHLLPAGTGHRHQSSGGHGDLLLREQLA